jgi:hypothetical protein
MNNKGIIFLLLLQLNAEIKEVSEKEVKIKE